MTIAGFLFAAVAGFLVGTIGSSNNPISGLTLSTLIVAAILMVIVGVKGAFGVAAVLGVAAVVCCSSGVAGDIIQDLKAGHILGGTPRAMEIGCIIGVIAAAFVMALVLQLLHTGYASTGGIGGTDLPAPQAGLMAMLAQGIITGQMAWPLVIMGAIFAIALILIGAPSPMLIAVGMYLPFHTTFAIFIGGIIKWIADGCGPGAYGNHHRRHRCRRRRRKYHALDHRGRQPVAGAARVRVARVDPHTDSDEERSRIVLIIV
jgi:putative OPT family oligopeptide transporter